MQVREGPGGQRAEADDRHLVAELLRKDRKATAEFVALCADCVYPFLRHRLSIRKLQLIQGSWNGSSQRGQPVHNLRRHQQWPGKAI